MNTAIKYANENGIEALKEALPASFNPSARESIVRKINTNATLE